MVGFVRRRILKLFDSKGSRMPVVAYGGVVGCCDRGTQGVRKSIQGMDTSTICIGKSKYYCCQVGICIGHLVVMAIRMGCHGDGMS